MKSSVSLFWLYRSRDVHVSLYRRLDGGISHRQLIGDKAETGPTAGILREQSSSDREQGGDEDGATPFLLKRVRLLENSKGSTHFKNADVSNSGTAQLTLPA